MIDFNTAEEQSTGGGSPAPEGSIIPCKMTIRPPKPGKEGTQHNLLCKSGKGNGNEYLDVEFEALGSFAGSKFWQMFTVYGSEAAAKISMRTLRAIVESARGTSPKDSSPAAAETRKLSDWADFNEMTFLLKVGVEVTQNKDTGKWYVNNTISRIVTKDDEEYLAGEHISDKPLPIAPATGEHAAAGKPAAGAPAGGEWGAATGGPAPTGPVEGTTAAPAPAAKPAVPVPDWAAR